ncbi:unnamed protein product [Meganyctiphanes norvegica]|uniref:Uncharacterized protein n=1 Tax=Meganyctiphanes norvegica TaxID=48144 RepID=A0AAV2SC41_MEGNR
MRTLVALCMVLGCCSAAPAADLLSHVGVPSPVADVTRLSVAQLLGSPLQYMHGIPYLTATDADTEDGDSEEGTTAIHAIPYAVPHGIPFFSVPGAVTEEGDDSDEETTGTTAVHAIPYAWPQFSFGPAILSETDDAAVPADTSKLAVKYVQPTVGNAIPYNNFPFFGHNFYNYQNPLTYSGGAYPYHFGFPYSFGYNFAPTTYAAAVQDSSLEEDD